MIGGHKVGGSRSVVGSQGLGGWGQMVGRVWWGEVGDK